MSPTNPRDNEGFTKKSKNTSLCPTSPKPPHCRSPYRATTMSGMKWKRCGRPKCCRECRDLWAWRHTTAIWRSVRTLPATHFLTLRRSEERTDQGFSRAVSKFWKSLKRRCHKTGGIEYLLVHEWRDGIHHAHALVRVEGRVTRRMIRDAKQLAGLHVSWRPIRNQLGAVAYIFKHTMNPERKAELPPVSFQGKVFTTSRRFLTKPLKTLWREYRDERAGTGYDTPPSQISQSPAS